MSSSGWRRRSPARSRSRRITRRRHPDRDRGALMRSVMCVMLGAVALQAAEPTPREVFEQRLLPIFRSPNPSSCVQCHLAGIDLKDYILPDHEKTFRNLRDQGLINLRKPEDSKILQLIERGRDDRARQTIQQQTLQTEYDAFKSWIVACAADPALKSAPALPVEERKGPAVDAAAIRYARMDRIAVSFEQNVWAYRFRCMNCHFEGHPQAAKLREKYGLRVGWMKKS